MKNKGFTLIELLIVVAIIAILAAIAVPNFLEAQTRSKVSRVKADMRSWAVGVESYRTDHSVPPVAVYPGQSYGSQLLPDYYCGPAHYNLYVEQSNDYGVTWQTCVNFLMTTPIAYISRFTPDPFWAQTAHQDELSIYYAGLLMKNPASLYGMRGHNAPLDALSSGGWSGSTPGRYKNVSWYLDSCGPWGWFNYGWAFDPTDSNYEDICNNEDNRLIFTYCVYDPTNGSGSEGQIVYLGNGHGFK